MSRSIAALAVAGLALPLCAQTPATIRGRVVAAETGEPIANARVTATMPAGAIGVPVVLTDDDGRFTLPLPERAGRVAAKKTGFAAREVPAAAGRDAIEIRLEAGAVISGRVADEFGEPIQSARITLFDAAPGAKNRAVAFTSTDDRGEYRAGSLSAGRYFVAALTSGPPVAVLASGGRTSSSPYRQWYFPSGSTVAEAEAIELQAGEERPRIDLAVPGASSTPEPFTVPFSSPSPGPPVARPGEPATSIVRGRVTTTDGRALRLAEVRIFAPGLNSVSTRADSDGRYEFSALPAGRYSLLARKTGYGPIAVAAVPTGRAQTRIVGIDVELGAGEVKEHVDIPLTRWGTLSGRVVDERGDAVQSARVELLHVRYEAGRRRLVAAAAGLTDDLGRYRLFSIPPGQYVVSAVVGDVLAAELPGYPRTFYPGTSEAGQAQLVPVDLGQDQSGIDLALSRTRTARVSGRVVDAAGAQAIIGSLTMSASRFSASVTDVPFGARITKDGEFEFANVPPGQYVIRADRGGHPAGTEGEFGSLAVSVDGADLTGLLLQTSRGSTIHGHFTFAAAGAQRPPPNSIELWPTPVDFDLSPKSFASADIHSDWTFDLAGINGPRRLELVRTPPGWALDDIRVNGASVIDRAIAFGRPEQSLRDVEVVLTDRASELSGTIADDNKQPAAGVKVVVFPTDRDRWYPWSRFFRVAETGAGGTYTVGGLPFGSYYVAALARLPDDGDDAWQDPEFLATLIPRATSVIVREGQKQTVDLSVAGR